MFNLPFPTDSLYKFAFMFGLVLIIFSLYYRDKQLNRFDKTQSFHTIDSLNQVKNLTNRLIQKNKSLENDLTDLSNKLNLNYIHSDFYRFALHKIKDVYTPYNDDIMSNRITSLIFSLNSIGNELEMTNKNKSPSDSSEFKQIDLVIKEQKSEILKLGDLVKESQEQRIESVKREIEFNENKVSEDKWYFYLLLFIGFALFILGTIGWYYKIQKPQDQLLVLQVKQIEDQTLHNKVESKILVVGRKHIDPANIK